MPRIKRGLEKPPKVQFPELAEDLLDELKSNRQGGQPVVEERYFPKTNAVRVTVIWDKWAPLSDEERTSVILEAYSQAEGAAFRDRIAIAIGLTVPEAYESGLLPYHVAPALRKGDPVTPEQCDTAMIQEGASVLFDSRKPQLRFATEAEAAACVKRLNEALPGSEPVWVIAKEVGRADE
jgi:hypothetical protein